MLVVQRTVTISALTKNHPDFLCISLLFLEDQPSTIHPPLQVSPYVLDGVWSTQGLL